METLDIIILVCFIPALVQGLRNGFISQFISLAAIFFGAWLAFRFSEVTCDWLANYLPNVSGAVLHALGFVIVFVIVVLILHFIGNLLEKVLKFATLGWLDKLLGLAFALAKAALVLGLIAIVFSTLNDKFGMVSAEKLDASMLYNPIKDMAYKVFPYLKSLIFKQ